MHSHCPTCTTPLGSNRVLESCPVGRRMAFDSVRGRFWILCPRCRSWNLLPLEDRWEPIDEAERLFESAVIGARTQRIAIGRVADGTELVRVGDAEEGELAGWRYGRELVGRWRRHRRLVAGSVGVAGVLTLVPAVGLGAVVSLYAGLGAGGLVLRRLRSNRPVFRRTEGEGPEPGVEGGPEGAVFRERDLQRLLLVPGPGRRDAGGPPKDEGWRALVDRWHRPPLELDRWEAKRALRAMLAVWNAEGGSPTQVRRATARVVELGTADRVLARAAQDLNRGNAWEYHMAWPFLETARIQWADRTLRLAVEIAAHEDLERRALEGELRVLEREWAMAEELAGIEDELLAPRWPWSGRNRREDPIGH
jgi:hypothetical protein